jgi:hypothetical protein
MLQLVLILKYHAFVCCIILLLHRMTSDGNMNTKGSSNSSTRNSNGRNGRDSTQSSAATTPEKEQNDDTTTSKSSGNRYDSARSCSPSPQRQQAVTRALRQEDMFKIGLEEEGIRFVESDTLHYFSYLNSLADFYFVS